MESAEQSYLKKGMMNRIGWFTYLRLVFQNVPKTHPNKAWRSAFVNELLAFQSVYNYPLTLIESAIEKRGRLRGRNARSRPYAGPNNRARDPDPGHRNYLRPRH